MPHILRRSLLITCFVASFWTGNILAADDAPPQVLFKNVNIFNGTEDKLYENHQVLVHFLRS